MIGKMSKLNPRVIYMVTVAMMLSFTLVSDIQAQYRVKAEKPERAKLKLKAQKADLKELKNFCKSGHTLSSKRDMTSTYACQTGIGKIKAGSGAARSEINCDYSEEGGSITWLGCACKSNDEGNCNNFISNCVEGGDDVGGNSGGASCSPGGG